MTFQLLRIYPCPHGLGGYKKKAGIFKNRCYDIHIRTYDTCISMDLANPHNAKGNLTEQNNNALDKITSVPRKMPSKSTANSISNY